MLFSSQNLISIGYLSLVFVFYLQIGYFPHVLVQATPEDDAIAKWAENFGEELWELGKYMTKSREIKSKYTEYHARVEEKDGESLMESILENVSRMLTRKVDAIKCIQMEAEAAAEQFQYNETMKGNFTYYSSKYSPIDGSMISINDTHLPRIITYNRRLYRPMDLEEDTHFYNISVNTDHSSVHVPTNIYDLYDEVAETIMWSESLDDVFVQNYKSDPELSWQYFGSDTGILRHYPALKWEEFADKADVYDCRKRSWYIETATCSKDIVILLDNSGSMHGFGHTIAKFTIRSILDTFSNNDFFNIYWFNDTVEPFVECFRDYLVQATPENTDVFYKAVQKVAAGGYANFTQAFAKAFELLEQYRFRRRCNETASGCNQAIMLVTDGVPGNLTEVFDMYNRVMNDNSTKIPVRIFTYLLGKEVTKVREIQWMACLNRGYYSHIQTLDQVQEEVLKYVDVIATPLVLQEVEHPPTWTHVFADKSYVKKEKNSEEIIPRLMIAVGVPAFNKKAFFRNSTRKTGLLGVAGTDIPLTDIDELTLPYKLGVNGYSFILSNNGYVILHPELKPVERVLKINYNSIDITEIEQFLDDVSSREPSDRLMVLRNRMVFHERGNMTNIAVKFHYDNMRRVSIEYQDYYFAPLVNTPFSLGLVLPSRYGKTWIKVSNEVQNNQFFKINMLDYFIGENWKVHPDWVYCKYHYLEGHEFKNSEAELLHFIEKMNGEDWQWYQQYEQDNSSKNQYNELNCGRQTLGPDSYYCNEELVQLLIFDAKVTNTSYQTWKYSSERERHLIEDYNATLRFVATMSGLTRWQFIFGEIEIDSDREFGDYHSKAIDEPWYRSAILQHAIDPESFVYSIPHPADRENEPPGDDLKVSASQAIFPRDGKLEAPGCVVGFQFSHSKMFERFMNITSQENCNGCILPCHHDTQGCYVIDNNGYIILSKNPHHTGIFFGEVEGAILKAMVEQEIFENITVYDLQGYCYSQKHVLNDASSHLNPLKLILLGIEWLFTELVLYFSHLHFWSNANDYIEDNAEEPHTEPPLKKEEKKNNTNNCNSTRLQVEESYNACDRQSNLYVLDQKMFIMGKDFSDVVPITCGQPFHVKRIPNSNLLLVVVNRLHPRCERVLRASPEIIIYPEEFPCYKLNLSHYDRRRLEECFTEHADEEEYSYCGGGNGIHLKYAAIIGSIIATTIAKCTIYAQI